MSGYVNPINGLSKSNSLPSKSGPSKLVKIREPIPPSISFRLLSPRIILDFISHRLVHEVKDLDPYRPGSNETLWRYSGLTARQKTEQFDRSVRSKKQLKD